MGEKIMLAFHQKLKDSNISLIRDNISTLQINLGKMCNQACHHCHVEAGPKRTEIMEKSTMDVILALLDKSPDIKVVDLTGGAPELNPNFKYLVTELKKRNKHIIDRCNLTILFEPNQEYLAEFLAEQKVEICASLPCYLEDNVDAQRGKGVFDKSIKALNLLNDLGYGTKENLTLNLVYNPQGINLSPNQATLEGQYKIYLEEKFGIRFNNLFTITNMPIKRFLHSLMRDNLYDKYMLSLTDNFNEAAANNVMCKDLISIGWDGQIYDCDFNQMLEIPLNNSQISIFDLDNFADLSKNIAIANHCYGCTAGGGSSCAGSLT
jgi:radical SAM/Cys-rich protein